MHNGCHKDCDSDIPSELAEAIFNSVSEYSKSNFDAAALTIEIINDCIEEQKGNKGFVRTAWGDDYIGKHVVAVCITPEGVAALKVA